MALTPSLETDQDLLLLALLSEHPLGRTMMWLRDTLQRSFSIYIRGGMDCLLDDKLIYSGWDGATTQRYYFLTASGWLKALALEQKREAATCP